MSNKYNLIDTLDKLEELDKLLMDGDKPRYKVLAFDTETNGLQLYKSTVIGFSISFDRNTGYYVPFLRWNPDKSSLKKRSYKKQKYDSYTDGSLQCVWTGETFDEFVTPEQYDISRRVPLIPKYMKRWLTSTNLVMHNAPFDINMVYTNVKTEDGPLELKENLFMDTGLAVHIIDENESTGLKQSIERYKNALGINPHALAAVEKKELDTSIIEHGGTPGNVWRAKLEYLSKYACADTFFTYCLYEESVKDLEQQFGADGLDWFFNKEVMPICKEVVVDMKRRGVYIDVPHFKKMYKENKQKMHELEDSFIERLNSEGLLEGFNKGKSLDEEVTPGVLVKEIVKKEKLKLPQKLDKKTGKYKGTLAKSEVKKRYEEDPHWVWGYILGEDEIKYSDEELRKLKEDIYRKRVNRRYRFNISSGDHLIWLFCDKLGEDKLKFPQTKSATKSKPRPSLEADVLKEFLLEKYPWVQTIITYRKLNKLQTSYILPALNLNIDGWLYMDMKQNGTVSGRFSCSGGFNLQTLPRVDDEMELLESCNRCASDQVNVVQEVECIADRHCNNCGYVLKDITRPSSIKKGFIAPPGYKIVNADYSSLEPRCFAYMSNEDSLKEVYRKGLDLYSQVYCDIFDQENQYSADPTKPNFLKKVAKGKRTWIKPTVLGIPYGSNDFQVAKSIGATRTIVDKKTGESVEITDVKEGRRVRDLYLNTYKNLKTYMEQQELKALELGYVETIIGRKRHFRHCHKIYEVMKRYGYDYSAVRGIINLSPSKISDYQFDEVDEVQGIRLRFSRDMLRDIQEVIDIREDLLKEKSQDKWDFIRYLLKDELNQAKNAPIQGIAGHITNKGMLETTRKFKEKNIEGYVFLQVHDEISIYAKEESSQIASDCLKIGMEDNEFTRMIDVPMVAEPIIANNLMEAK